MYTVKAINNRPCHIGGEKYSGWLPPSAATPLPMPVREICLNFEIQFDGYGYLLCYESTDGTIYGGTWHETSAEALECATDWFGIAASEWKLQ